MSGMHWQHRRIWDLTDTETGHIYGHVWDCGTGRYGWTPDDDRIGVGGEREASLKEAQRALWDAVQTWQSDQTAPSCTDSAEWIAGYHAWRAKETP